MSERHDDHATYGLEAEPSAVTTRGEAADLAPHDADDGSNDHLTSIYEGREEQFATVVPFIRDGLERDERCVYVADDNTKAQVLSALREGGVDVDAALESDALSVHTKADAYLRTDEFDRDAMIEYWQNSLAEARDVEGYEGLRAAAEMTWALDEDLDLDRLVGYEAILNTIYPGDDYVVLCQYSRDRFPADVLSDVIRSHPLVAHDGTVCRNCHYESPAQFFEDDRPALDVDRTIEGLLTRERTRSTLDERERRLTALTDVTGDLLQATPRDVCERAIETARDTVGARVGAVWLYDGSDDALGLAAVSEARAGTDDFDVDSCVDLAWETLTDGDSTVYEDRWEAIGPTLGRSPGAGLFVPLGRHGVFMVGRTASEQFTDADVDFVEALATTTAAALDRTDREGTLRERERELERKQATIERLEGIHAILRDVNRELVGAETRAEVERAVCERLVAETDVSFSWIGEPDPPGVELVPAEWAGEQRGYLEGISLRTGEETSREPSVRASRTGEVTVAPDVIDDLGSDGWASRALSAGFHSVVSVPLTYDGVQYGVLSAYAERSGAFDGRLAGVLGDVGDTVAYAINATQRKQALLTDTVTELEFEIRDRSCPILALARSAECSIELQDVLSRPSEGVLALVTVPVPALDRLIAAVEDSAVVETTRPVAETDGRWLVQLAASGSLIAEELADHGARLEALTADQDSVRIRVDAPSSYPHAVVEMVRNAYPSAELIARRHDREPDSGRDDGMRFWERLTDRQREVAQLAYYGGYFDRPREHTGGELAERLEISSQAFHKHLRHIQQTLFETTIEDGPGERG